MNYFVSSEGVQCKQLISNSYMRHIPRRTKLSCIHQTLSLIYGLQYCRCSAIAILVAIAAQSKATCGTRGGGDHSYGIRRSNAIRQCAGRAGAGRAGAPSPPQDWGSKSTTRKCREAWGLWRGPQWRRTAPRWRCEASCPVLRLLELGESAVSAARQEAPPCAPSSIP